MLGGISTGQDISVSIAIKPTSSIRTPRRSIDKEGNPVMVETFGRHDPCVGIRATPIAEAMLALVLIDHALMHRAQCGDVCCFDAEVEVTSRRRIVGSTCRNGSDDGDLRYLGEGQLSRHLVRHQLQLVPHLHRLHQQRPDIVDQIEFRLVQLDRREAVVPVAI